MKILLVDDDPEIRMLAGMALEKIGGFEVVKAGEGSRALELTAEVMPDAILLDYFLPGMNGREILKKILENPSLRTIPVIFLTGKSETAEIESFTKSGAKGVLTKPFNPLTLSEQVKDILDT